MSEYVRITDVSPRDGLQNELRAIPTREKTRLIELLVASGVDEIEVSSFVSPKWVPQLGDAAEVFDWIAGRELDRAEHAPILSALVPNEKGMQAALAVNERAGRKVLGKVSVFTAASEGFTRNNANATIAETLERFKPVIAAARASELSVRAYVSCIVQCPFDGPTLPEKVADVCARLCDMGVDELDLGETLGVATPTQIGKVLDAVAKRVGRPCDRNITLHLHDTNGQAANCIVVALERGVRSFDGSAGGLGGCPYASSPGRRAPGNIPTEVLLSEIETRGFATRVDGDALSEAAQYAQSLHSGR